MVFEKCREGGAWVHSAPIAYYIGTGSSAAAWSLKSGRGGVAKRAVAYYICTGSSAAAWSSNSDRGVGAQSTPSHTIFVLKALRRHGL